MTADLKTLVALDTGDFSFILYTVLFIVGILLFISLFSQDASPKDNYSLSREHIRDLIKGKVKPRVAHNGNYSKAHDMEIAYSMYRYQYQMGKMFELASQSPNNKLNVSSGVVIAPHSREHGLNSGKNAELLRLRVMEQYGIDLETLEDTPEEYLRQIKPKPLKK